MAQQNLWDFFEIARIFLWPKFVKKVYRGSRWTYRRSCNGEKQTFRTLPVTKIAVLNRYFWECLHQYWFNRLGWGKQVVFWQKLRSLKFVNEKGHWLGHPN